MMSTVGFTLLISSALHLCTAHKEFMNLIPNGHHVPHPCGGDRVWQGLGHHYPEGAKGTGGVRNAFGLDFKAAGLKWTNELCMKDSDMDGRTNGEELGDPDCSWKPGTQPKGAAMSHPGICEPLESAMCRHKNHKFGDRINCTALTDKPCPALAEPDVLRRDVRFPLTPVPNVVTSYTCMAFDLPQEGDYHLVATTPIVNNSNIVHHMILFGCDFPENFNQTLLNAMKASPYQCEMTPHLHCQQFLSTWTYGFKEDCLSRDAGFRIGKHGTRIAALQIHWNNPQKQSGQTDSSGLTIYYTTTKRRYDASVFVVGQQYLDIPPGSSGVAYSATCPGKCTSEMFKEKIFITRAANHMHYLGKSQRISLYRNGTRIRYLTNEENFHYDRPLFYHFDPPIEVLPGDDIKTECTYNSDPQRRVTYGAGTDNEMCFGFLTYYPVQDFLQTLCISWKSVQRCMRKLPKFQGMYHNCDMKKFSQEQSIAAIKRMFANDSCGYYMETQKCNKQCTSDSVKLLQNPCLQGDLGEFLSFRAQIPIQILRTCAQRAGSSAICVVYMQSFVFMILVFFYLV